VEFLEDMIDKTINRMNNKAGFKNAGIYPTNSELILNKLPEKYPSFLQNSKLPKRQSFEISNEVISDLEFLNKWESYMNEKEELKKRKKEKIDETKIKAEERKKEKFEKDLQKAIKKIEKQREDAYDDDDDVSDDNNKDDVGDDESNENDKESGMEKEVVAEEGV
jgi:hypothetical protein